MAATRSRSKRGRRRESSALPIGKDEYVVVQDGVDVSVKAMKPLALLAAQERAQRALANPGELTVERRSLFGPTATLYRIVLDEDGNVSTYTIYDED